MESVGPTRDPSRSEPGEGGEPKNLPKFKLRDKVGIFVALFGTLALVVLAADCSDPNVQHEEGGKSFVQFAGGCAVRYILAGAFALINLAHVVGLVLFESVNYHGGFAKFFARLSLYGTLVAIAVSALIGPTS
jgi:hypothetical protein